MTTAAIISNSVLPTPIPSPTPPPQSAKCDDFVFSDKLVQQLLSKLDEGTTTIMNLRSLLNLKAVELNELISQLELIDQVLNNVENGTEQIELVLKDVMRAGKDKLLDAKDTLDSAIKSASSHTAVLYSTPIHQQTYKRTEKQILQTKMNELISFLEIDAKQFFSKDDDENKKDEFEALQMAYIDLDLAKSIASTIKSDLKQRSTLIKSASSFSSSIQIKQLNEHVKNQLKLFKSYTRNAAAPLLYQGKEVLSILDRDDPAFTKRKTKIPSTMHNNNLSPIPSPIPSPVSTRQKKRGGDTTTSLLHNKNNNTIHNNKSSLTIKSTTPVHNTPTRTILHTNSPTNTLEKNNTNKQSCSFSRHTSSSKAKSKEPKSRVQDILPKSGRPGSTLRLRNMLAKRVNYSPTTALLQQQQRICV